MLEKDGKTIVKILLTVLIISAIAGYSYYQSRNLINGPEITLTEPLNGITVSQPLITITGVAKNVISMSLNDHQIYTDNNGLFKEELLLSPGYNRWKLEAKDKFGRVVSKNIELIFNKN